jgi:hypothetical protein
MKALVEPIGSLDSFAGHWMESAPLIGAVLAECLDLLAEQTPSPVKMSSESLARCAGELRRLAEEARALAHRPIPESFLLRVRSTLSALRHHQEVERNAA